MDVLAAYREVGSYRGAAEICGTTHKTVKRIVERHDAGGDRAGAEGAGPQLRRGGRRWSPSGWSEDAGADLGEAAAAGGPDGRAMTGRRGTSAGWSRRRKREWRRGHHRGRRPAVWTPGDTLVIDWGVLAGLHVFCAVLAWSRVPVRALRRRREGGHHAGAAGRVLRGPRRGPEDRAGRPDGLPEGRGGRQRGGADRRTTSASPPTTGSGRTSATAADPESKGIVENLVGYAKRDLMVPAADRRVADLAGGATTRGRGVVRRGQRRDAFGDLRGPGRAARAGAGAARGRCRRCGPRSGRSRSAARSTSCPASGSARPATRSRTG